MRARALAEAARWLLAIVDKRRDRPGESEVNERHRRRARQGLHHDRRHRRFRGGTLCNAADALLANGATSVTAYITHGVLSGGAVARITGSKLKELVITDSIQPTSSVEAAANIRVLPISDLNWRGDLAHGHGRIRVEPVRLTQAGYGCFQPESRPTICIRSGQPATQSL